MAKVEKLSILNPSDKTRMYSVAIGEGAPADTDDVIVSDIKKFPVGSQYTDTKNKKFYVRVAKAKAAADWQNIAGA